MVQIKLRRRVGIQPLAIDRIKVCFPNGEVRLMRPGPNTFIAKAVVEEFVPRFLLEPGIIFLADSGDYEVVRDKELARSIGLNLDFQRNLPEIVLADVAIAAPKVVFVEVVATDGAITLQRMEALKQLAEDAGYPLRDVYFVTAFADRGTASFRRVDTQIAWDSFVWFAAEPDKLVVFRDGVGKELTSLLSQ